MRRILTVLAAAIMLALAASAAWAEGIVKSTERAHLDALNRERAANGAEELAMSTALTEAARIRAKEIVTRFEHVRPSGAQPYSAISGWEQNKWAWGTVAENIAKGDRTVDNVINGWMNSQGHRDNMLDKSFNYCGLACYEDASGNRYWVQLFSVYSPDSDPLYEPQGQSENSGPIFNVDGAAYPDPSFDANITDLYTGAALGNMASVVKPAQDAGKMTLVIFTYGRCNYSKNFFSEFGKTVGLGNRDDLSIVVYSYDGHEGVKKWIDDGAAASKGWNNIKFVRGTPYPLLADAVNKAYKSGSHYQSEGASTPFAILLKGGRIVAFSDTPQSGLSTKWLNKINAIASGSDSSGGTDDDEQQANDPDYGTGYDAASDTRASYATSADAGVEVRDHAAVSRDDPTFKAVNDFAGGTSRVQLRDGSSSRSVFFTQSGFVQAVSLDVRHEGHDDGAVTIELTPAAGSSFMSTIKYFGLVRRKDGTGCSLFPGTVGGGKLRVTIEPVGDFFSTNTVAIYKGAYKEDTPPPSGGGSGGGCAAGAATAAAACALLFVRRRKG